MLADAPQRSLLHALTQTLELMTGFSWLDYTHTPAQYLPHSQISSAFTVHCCAACRMVDYMVADALQQPLLHALTQTLELFTGFSWLDYTHTPTSTHGSPAQ